jgi:disulfide bond formation protein DsbB
MPWPYRRLGTTTQARSTSAEWLASSIVGVAIGAISAAIFLAASLVMPARIALLAGLLAGLALSIPRATLVPWAQPISPMSAFALGAMLLARLEILSEIDLEWIAVTMLCSSAFGRAAIHAARRQPMVAMPPAHGAARLGCLVVGMLPLAVFGVWPEPVWGLWVAAAVTLAFAAMAKGRRWTSPMVLRFSASETVFALCVLALMSAAAITGLQVEATDNS